MACSRPTCRAAARHPCKRLPGAACTLSSPCRSIDILGSNAWSYVAVPLIYIFMMLIRTGCLAGFNLTFFAWVKEREPARCHCDWAPPTPAGWALCPRGGCRTACCCGVALRVARGAAAAACSSAHHVRVAAPLPVHHIWQALPFVPWLLGPCTKHAILPAPSDLPASHNLACFSRQPHAEPLLPHSAFLAQACRGQRWCSPGGRACAAPSPSS